MHDDKLYMIGIIYYVAANLFPVSLTCVAIAEFSNTFSQANWWHSQKLIISCIPTNTFQKNWRMWKSIYQVSIL